MSWTLHTATTQYRIVLGPDGLGPMLDHWGAGAGRAWAGPDGPPQFATLADLVPLEYTALGTRHVRGSDLVVDHGDGLVGARLRWDDAAAFTDDGERCTARWTATDRTEALRVALHVETSRAHDVVSKWVELTNTGSSTLRLSRAFGPAWELPIGPGARVATLSGRWSREFTPATVDLPVGELSLGSRQGVTSHSYAPVVALTARDDPDGTEHGAYGVALAWSGSWRLSIDAAPFVDRVRIAGGVDDESTVITLPPGAGYTSAPTLGVYAAEGIDGLPERWHHYQRTVSARTLGPEHHPIVYNSWYATGFDLRLDHQLRLAAIAADLGVEVFVLDDGWFRARSSDHAGLGDWTPDPVAFPDGLAPLIDGVTGLGLRFGLWVEPECVNPDSDLFRAHPDWVYRAGDRPLTTIRHQYVLDLGRDDVRSWVEEMLRGVLADPRISYLKWDMNRPVTDGGRPGDPLGRQWTVQHTHGYYRVMRMLREEFPHVTVEACASGGARIDLAVLGLSDVVWTSDETGPRDRLAIQHGFLAAYAPHVMSSWVTDEPDRLDTAPTSLEFRFVVAMAGVLGIGADLLAWDDDRRTRAAALVRRYIDLRPLIHGGRVVRHGSPADPVYALEYGGDAGLGGRRCLLVYARASRPSVVRLRPRTLEPGRTYRVPGSTTLVTGGDDLEVPFALGPDADVLVLDPVP